MALDWTKSGRSESFEFKTLPNTVSSISTASATGTIKGVTRCELNWSYDSSDKVSGTMDVVDLKTFDLNNSLVRIYYKATLDGKTEKVLLATMYMVATKGHYEDGKYSGQVELKSTLCRFSDDKLAKAYTIKKGTKASALFKSLHTTYGGWRNWDGATDFEFSKNYVIDFGETIMEVLQKCKGGSKNHIDVDKYGRTRIRKWKSPSGRSPSYTVPTGGNSVTFPGLDIEKSAAGTINRFAMQFKYRPKNAKKDTVINAVAEVDASKSFSKKSTGRYITETEELSELSDKTKAGLAKVAKSRLSANASTFSKYTFTSFYLPISIGDVITFKYGSSFSFKAIVVNIDMEMEDCLTMTTTVRAV